MWSRILKDIKEYLNPILIETGTNKGVGIQAAKDAGFKKIISIEISRNLCEKAVKRFKNDDNIFVVQGDSSVVLWSIIKNIRERITFVLDAHNLLYGGDVPTDSEFEWWPLMKELAIISKHSRKDHTIIIDDVHLFESCFNTSLLEVTLFLRTLNSDYSIYQMESAFGDSLLVAEIKNTERNVK